MSLELHQRWSQFLGASRLPRSPSRAASAHLDLIRGVAAWLVMWGHLRNLFFVDFENVEHGSRLVKVVYLLTGFGHQSVVVFFVLSGFLISGTVIKRFVSGGWSWRGYAIDRLTRLYLVLIPGLLFGLLWDKTGSVIFASTGLYSQPLTGFGSSIVRSRITFPAFFGTLAFLQTLVSPVFGSNGPLWSLANEFWYYALFPVGLAALVAWAKQRIRQAVLLSVLAIAMAEFVKTPILPGFLIWMAGCALVVAYSRFDLRRGFWLIAYLLIASIAVFACLAASRTRNSGALGSDIALGVTFSVFLFGILQIELGSHQEGYAKVAHLLAGFSYSLYVLHFPLLLFVRAWLVSSLRWQPNIPHLFYGLMIGAVTLLFAWSVSIFTEKKTATVRAWVDSVIPRYAKASFGQQTAYATGRAGALKS
jgi:peptidoglycan/LPS O-acetylase OafA/YrhL